MTAAAGQARRKASIHLARKTSLQPRLMNVTQQDIRKDSPKDMKNVAINLLFMPGQAADFADTWPISPSSSM